MDFISIEEENQTDVKHSSENNNNKKNSPKGKLSDYYKSENGITKKRKNHSRIRKGGGVIYLGHIPHGFYEDEMESYFNQFGKVMATAVSRSKKTGRSRGYGFVQFENEEVAKIAAETMNNYLMFNKILKCRYIPPEERKINVFRSARSTHNYPRQENRKIELMNKKRAFSKLNQATYLKKVEKKIKQFKKYYEQNGINFTFKINVENEQGNSANNENKKNETKISSNDEKCGNETENINGVLEIDESEDEISFKTPPQVKKIIKKSQNSPALPSSKSVIIEKVKKNNSVPKITQKQEKSKKKTKLILPKQTHKNKETKEKLIKMRKRKELLKKPLSTKRVEKGTSHPDVSKNPERKVKRKIDSMKSKVDKSTKKGGTSKGK